MKKLIILSLVGIGIYLLLSRRKAFAGEVSETPTKIPSIPQAPNNPAISMVDQIIKDIEEKYKTIIPAPAPVIAPEPTEVCKQVKFITFKPFISLIRALNIRPIEPKTAVETICGPNLKTVQEKAELRAQTIFSPIKATFQFLD